MKKSYLIFCASFGSIILSLCLCWFVIPAQIPILFNFQEQIILLGSKWILSVFWFLTIASCSINLRFNKNLENHFLLNLNFAWIYVNIFLSGTLCFISNYLVGNFLNIPLSTLFGFPISFVLVSVPYTLKNMKYKSKFGIRNKFSLENEFLWTQTHIIAFEKLKPICLLLFLLALIFSPFRLFFIELAVFTISLVISFLIIIHESKRIYLKYKQMEARKNNLNSAKNTKK